MSKEEEFRQAVVTEKRYMAYHEAGHVLLNEVFGFSVKWVDLDYAGGAKTQTEQLEFDLRDYKDNDAFLMNMLAVVVAGMMVEQKHRRQTGDPVTEDSITYSRGWKEDREDIGRIQNVAGRERFDAFDKTACGLAEKVIEIEWRTIETLAADLLRYGRLGGWEVRRITNPAVERIRAAFSRPAQEGDQR